MDKISNDNKKLSLSKVDENELYAKMSIVIDDILSKSPEIMSREDVRLELLCLKDHIHIVNNRIEDVDSKTDYFNKTNNVRKLYSREDDEIDSPTLYDTFGIPSGVPFERVRKIFEHNINDKHIMLFGGGQSMMDLLTENKFHPASITNIDPYIKDEVLEKNSRGIYRSIVIGAESTDLMKTIHNEEIPAPDEIWATYSVPLYLENVKDIENLFANVDSLLAKGGSFRVYPIALLNFATEKNDLFSRSDNFNLRQEAWIKSLMVLCKKENYNLEIINNTTMHLQKIF